MGNPEPPSSRIEIERARGSDWPAVRRLCCETGKAGAPIEPERFSFFGEFWVGPYQKLRPEWTYVARHGTEVVGYLTGCPDTLAFERARKWRFAPALLLRLLFGAYRRNSDTRRFYRRLFAREKSPEESFAEDVQTRLEREFPAHLHVNVSEAFRSAGVGARLMERYFEDLRGAGVPGIHVHCGAKPVKFYERNGFEELSRLEFRPGVQVFVLGKRLKLVP